MQPTGTVLVLAADMVRAVLHASRARHARPQCAIQVYIPPGARPFCTWAVLAIMWHLAPVGTPMDNTEDVARDLHAWPVDQVFPWPRPKGDLPVAAVVQGLSLAPTLQRNPNSRQARSLPPRWGQGGNETQRRHNRCRTPGSPIFGTCPRAPWPMLPRPSRGLTCRPSRPTPCPAACSWERPGFGGDRTDALARTSPWCKGRSCFTPRAWELWCGVMVPDTACRWITATAPHPMQQPLACHHLLRTVCPLSSGHALTREVWRALLGQCRDWMTAPGTRYPPGTELEQLTAPTHRVRHFLHRAAAK